MPMIKHSNLGSKRENSVRLSGVMSLADATFQLRTVRAKRMQGPTTANLFDSLTPDVEKDVT